MLRRDFMKSTLGASTLVSMGAATVPTFLTTSARAAADAKENDKIVVVVQLIGGNDGLNTVVPHGIDGYNKGRRALRISSGQVHNITKEIGLHPSMGAMSKLIEDGRMAVVQGVGYPNPDRSHFRSMEIWESARMDAADLDTGWLGRALDARPIKAGADLPGLHIGQRSTPIALRSKKTEVPSLTTLEQYRLQLTGSDVDKRAEREALERLVRINRADADPLLGFVRRSTLAAYDSSKRLEQVSSKGMKPSYPTFGLAKRLELIAQIIKAGFGTRIFYTSLDGFDTHANQLGSHAALLTELSDSIGAFHKDLADAGQADRVALLTFSEFGRRVAENASQGTDHGAAAPLFVVGPVEKAGLVGAHPKFDDLDDGDLKYHTDFRTVYATLLEKWLGLNPAPIVGEGFKPLNLFKAAKV